MSDGTKKDGTPRATPGKMTTWIGKWNEDKSAFTVQASLIGATDKATKEAITKLGYGKYDTITGRADEHTFRKVERDAFA